jgi:peptide/nickel transport system permease protein
VRRSLVARLWQSLIVVAVVTTISFFIVHSAPGDPFAYDNSLITPAIRAQLRAEFGYDKPISEQFVRYLGSLSRGHLGYSLSRQQYVSQALAEALPRTLALTGLALALSLALGVLVGVVQAARRGGWFDRISSAALLVLYSLPDFWGALMALLLFAQLWRLFPAGGMVEEGVHDYLAPWPAFVDRLKHLVLPVASFTLMTVAGIARYQRAAMLEVLPSDFVRTARAKGVPERGIIWRHALRTALTPMITLLGVLLPALLGGALFIEKVFQWPGMGWLAANAIMARDYDLVTATVIVGSLMVIAGNLVADVLQAAVDPRVRA